MKHKNVPRHVHVHIERLAVDAELMTTENATAFGQDLERALVALLAETSAQPARGVPCVPRSLQEQVAESIKQAIRVENPA
jgi:hypothetical protein